MICVSTILFTRVFLPPKHLLDYTINLRSILLLIAMLQGLVIAALLLARGLRRRQTADFVLAGLLFFLVCSLIEHFIGFMGVYDFAREQGHDLTFFPFHNPLMYGPLILLYTRALTDGQFRWEKRDGLHFALPLLYYLVHFSVWAMPDAEKLHFLNDTVAGYNFRVAIEAIFYPVTAWYVWQSFQRFQSYYRLIEQEYANTGRITLDWMRVFLYAFVAYLAFDLLFSIFALKYSFWYTGWYWLNLTRALLLYYISVAGWAFAQKSNVPFDVLEHRTQAEPQNLLEAPTPATGKTLMTAEELSLRRTQLSAFMENEKPWLDPELTLSILGEQLKLNTSQLSFLINNGFHQNFNDFVNTYRAEEVKRKMASPNFQHLSLLGIAFESGFNSKATFNRAFKKRTGKAPSEYK